MARATKTIAISSSPRESESETADQKVVARSRRPNCDERSLRTPSHAICIETPEWSPAYTGSRTQMSDEGAVPVSADGSSHSRQTLRTALRLPTQRSRCCKHHSE